MIIKNNLNKEIILKTNQEKQTIIEKEFNDIDINRSKTISFLELSLYLDRISNGNFDKQILTKIYSKIEKDSNGEISLDEFKKVWLNVDEQLNMKMKKLSDEINDINNNEKKWKEERIKIEKEEQNKTFTELNIKINRATNCKFDCSYIVVKINEESFETKKVENKNPIFDEKKIIKLNKDNKKKLNLIKFKLIDTFNPNNYLIFECKLEDLEDQKIHTEYLTNSKDSTKLNVELQWKYSDKLFIDLFLENWKNTRKQKIQERNQIEENLIKLYKPIDFIKEIAKNKFYLNTQFPSNNLTYSLKNENKFAMTPPKPDHFFISYTTILGIILFSFCLISQLFKFIYLIDIFISLFLILNYHIKTIELKGELLISFVCIYLLSLIIDIVWLYFYTINFWNTIYIDDGNFITHRKYAIIMSYIILIIKIFFFLGLLGYYWIERQTLLKKNNKISNNDIPLTLKK